MSTLGVTDKRGNVPCGLVYTGIGVPQTSMMGAFLAEAVQGREHPERARRSAAAG